MQQDAGPDPLEALFGALDAEAAAACAPAPPAAPPPTPPAEGPAGEPPGTPGVELLRQAQLSDEALRRREEEERRTKEERGRLEREAAPFIAALERIFPRPPAWDEQIGHMRTIHAGRSLEVLSWTPAHARWYDALVIVTERPGDATVTADAQVTLKFGSAHAGVMAEVTIDVGLDRAIRLPGDAGYVICENKHASVDLKVGAFLSRGRVFSAPTRTVAFASLADGASTDIDVPAFASRFRVLAQTTDSLESRQLSAADAVLSYTEWDTTLPMSPEALRNEARQIRLTNNSGSTIATGAIVFELAL